MSKNQLQVLVDEIVEHLKVVSSLKSFEQVQMWDSKSKDYIQTIQYQLSVLTQQLHELSLKYKDQSLEFQNLGFLKKIGKKDPSIETLSSINTYNESISILNKLRDGLEEWIDVTPDDVEECKSMIQEYKILRKELLLEKKSSTTSLRNTRENSMERMSNLGFVNGKVGRFARDIERMRKQKELNQFQSQRDEVEYRILQIDKRLMWLENIVKS
jgi:hypothetical protein